MLSQPPADCTQGVTAGTALPVCLALGLVPAHSINALTLSQTFSLLSPYR